VRDLNTARLGLYAAAANVRLDSLQKDEADATSRLMARRWIDAQGIRNPPRFVAMLVPGFP